MSGLEMLGAGVGIAGNAINAYSTLMGANQEADALERQKPIDIINGLYRAQALRYAGDTALASAQQQAIGQVTQKNLALSKAQSVAAASGGGAGPSDTSVVNLEAGVERQGEYNKMADIYSGESQRNALNDEAMNAQIGGLNKGAADQYAANTIRRNAKWQAAGTLLSGTSTAFQRYGQRVPAPESGVGIPSIPATFNKRMTLDQWEHASRGF